MNKTNLDLAKINKNDEFYTKRSDIDKELINYYDYLKNKNIYLNIDDENSEFFKYFLDNYKLINFNKCVATSINTNIKITILSDGSINKELLLEKGNFLSDECIEILKKSDIVITNPPFSIAREYFIPQLYKYNKNFIIIGDLNWITYKTIFPLFKENKIHFGYNKVTSFIGADGIEKKFGNKYWFTNLDIKKEIPFLKMTKKYNSSEYEKYDNYNAININKVKDIPIDYNGVMGVPISFLDKINLNQFSIIKFRKGDDEKDLSINGKCPYFRVLIKKN